MNCAIERTHLRGAAVATLRVAQGNVIVPVCEVCARLVVVTLDPKPLPGRRAHRPIQPTPGAA